MKPLVELNQISFGFERTTILDDVSLAIEPGQTVLLCGESGSGKSTLMKLINGYYPDNGGDLLSGTMRIQEQDMLPLNVVERTHYVRSIFQNARLSFSMRNLREELVFCLENVKTDPDKIDEIIARHTERFQLDYLLDRPFDECSGGELQRCAFICATLIDAPFYMLDEPFANVDDETVAFYMAEIEAMQAEGKSFLIIDHRVDLWQWVDRWLLLDESGQLVDVSADVLPEAEQRDLLTANGIYTEWDHTKKQVTATSDEVLLEVNNLTLENVTEVKHRRWFRREQETHTLLERVNLTVPKGRMIGLIGPSGGGKTSFFMALLRARDYSGQIKLAGQDIQQMKKADLYARMGLVFQDPSLQFVKTSVQDEIQASFEAWGLSYDEADIVERLSQYQLEAMAERSPWLLSQGQQRRLAVLCMTVGDQELLLVDEPTYGQDAVNARRVMDSLASLTENGMTCIFTSHDLRLVDEYADDVLELKDKTIKKVNR